MGVPPSRLPIRIPCANPCRGSFRHPVLVHGRVACEAWGNYTLHVYAKPIQGWPLVDPEKSFDGPRACSKEPRQPLHKASLSE